jgi:hypothetical protein
MTTKQQRFSMRAKYRGLDDDFALQQRAKYCRRMSIRLEYSAVNDDIILVFSGREPQLHELKEYLLRFAP